MLNIPLQIIPNQDLSIQLDNSTYDINIHDCNNIMAVTITINNTIIISGLRAVPGALLIPYPYLENGNFLITTANDDYPHWPRFSIDQFLIYGSQFELNALRLGV